jgi:hypothetical protein
MEQLGHILEIAMIIAFGFSWPNNIITTLRNKSSKGKSVVFLILIDFGYVCGIVGKILSGNVIWYVMFFYVLNFIMVSIDMTLYFYYRRKENSNG